MEAAPPVFRSRRIRQIYYILVVGMFLTGMALPLFQFNSDKTEMAIKEHERRFPNSMPVLEMHDLGRFNFPSSSQLTAFTEGLSKWFSDHIGFRHLMMYGYGIPKYYGFIPANLAALATGQPGTPERGTVIGKNGRLFYTGDRLTEDFRCSDPFTDEELAYYKSVFEERHRWHADRGIPYILMIAPNAQTIYPECMPDCLKPLGKSRLDQLVELMRPVPGFILVDVRSELMQAKQQYATFYNTDSHWNKFGAFIGTQSLIKRIGGLPRFEGLKPTPIEEFNIVETDDTVYAPDLVRMLNVPFGIPEHSVVPTFKVPPVVHRTTFPLKLNCYMGAEIAEAPAAKYPNVLVLHDSFFGAMKGYFDPHFKRVEYIMYFQGMFPYAKVEQTRPALVVEELVERRLMGYLPPNPSDMKSLGTELLVRQPSEPAATIAR